MKALLDYVSTVTDCRQEKKVRHKMMDIIMLVFFATLANADDWVEIEVFGKEHEDFLRNYLSFLMESLRMIRSREYLPWYPLNFWRISRQDGMKC